MRTAEEVLRTLVELHDIEQRGAGGSYDEGRRVKNGLRAAWREAREVLGLAVPKAEISELDKRSVARKLRKARVVGGKE